MITDALADRIRRSIRLAREHGDVPAGEDTVPVTLETPRNKLHGDFSSNVALVLRGAAGAGDARLIAQAIADRLPADDLIERVEVAGPGFLNLYLRPSWLQDALVPIESLDSRYGATADGAGARVLIEFVSANPTGPISVVNGRAAALGDVLANLLAAQGYEVAREFYVNDAVESLQLEKFAESVEIRYLQEFGRAVLMPGGSDGEQELLEPGLEARTLPESPLHFPSDGYRGEYVRDIARAIAADVGDTYVSAPTAERTTYFRRATLERMVAAQRAALEAFGVRFDRWFYESSLYDGDAVDATIARFRDDGLAYEKDGALWLKSSELGDDKDRVLVRSNGKATYIAADAAYHDDKFRRGFNRLIDIWGADHHGYVSRLKACVRALGYCPDALEIVLTQMVSLVRDGEVVMGGKRKGAVVELKEDLVDEIGKDAARFYFLLSSYDNPATVDVELAKKQSNENPVYYVQYAHARLCSILRRAGELALVPRAAAEVDRARLTEPAEMEVLRKLADYPGEVELAARTCAPHRLTRFAMDLAGLLNVFYENCRVLPGTDDSQPLELTEARLALVNGARIVLRNLFAVLGVTAPERM